MHKWWVAAVVVVDQLVKWWWQGEIVRNPGAWWGWVGLVAIGIIVYKNPKHPGWWWVVGGGLSNVIDRLGRGYVIDMFKLPFTAWFNVADVAIVGGALWLLISRK